MTTALPARDLVEAMFAKTQKLLIRRLITFASPVLIGLMVLSVIRLEGPALDAGPSIALAVIAGMAAACFWLLCIRTIDKRFFQQAKNKASEKLSESDLLLQTLGSEHPVVIEIERLPIQIPKWMMSREDVIGKDDSVPSRFKWLEERLINELGPFWLVLSDLSLAGFGYYLIFIVAALISRLTNSEFISYPLLFMGLGVTAIATARISYELGVRQAILDFLDL